MSGEAFDIIKAQRRIFESDLKANERLVALAILDFYSRKSPKPFPGIATLEARTDLCRNAVLAAIRGLEAAGAIGVKRMSGCSSTYDLAPLMKLPVRDVNQFIKWTGSPDELVRDVDPTGSPDEPPPVHEKDPKDPSEGTQRKEPSLPRSEAAAGSGSLSRSKKGKEEPERPGRQKLVDAYFSAFRSEHAQDPTFDSLDGKAINTLFDKCNGNVDRAVAYIGIAFRSFRKSNVTIQQIAKDPAAFTSASGKKVQHAPLDALASLGAKPTMPLVLAGGAK